MYFKKIFTVCALLVIFNFISACEEEIPNPEARETIEEASFLKSKTTKQEVDQPNGFQVEILAPHAPFPDDLAANFRLKFAEKKGKTIVKNFDDVSTMVVAEVNWLENGSSSGWHYHPGVALVTMVEGEIEVVWNNDCVPRTYSAGDGWLDPGEIHNARAISGGAKAYVTFLGIPEGEPATIWVEPQDCN